MLRKRFAAGVHRAGVGAVLIAVLGGCASPAPTPEPTPEPTESLEERIASYVESWGGSEGQYRIILTLDECENLGRLGLGSQETLDRLDEEGPANPEWRAANGYLGAILERIEEIDCPESIPVP
jgi:hypothetical protein